MIKFEFREYLERLFNRTLKMKKEYNEIENKNRPLLGEFERFQSYLELF